jgi:hypothetical protein
MNDRFKFWKVCARWVHRELKDREKTNQMGLSLQHLSQYVDEGEDMLNRIVTGDESWVHHYQPQTKECFNAMEKHSSSLSTKKCKVMSMPLAGKVMLMCFGILREYC